MLERLVHSVESYDSLKKSIDSWDLKPYESYVGFIDNLTMNAMLGSQDPVFQKYALMSRSMPVNYVQDSSSVASVCIENNDISLNINPVNAIALTENEDQVLFIIAHEMKHVLLGHLKRYVDVLKDQTVQVILNIALDYEVNEGLAREVLQMGSTSCIPNNMICRKNIRDFTGNTEYSFNQELYKGKGTPADIVFKMIDRNISKVLGYDLSEMVYQCSICKTSFASEIFTVANNGTSSVFKITDIEEARKLCRVLRNYLQDDRFTLLDMSGLPLLSGDEVEDILSRVGEKYSVLESSIVFHRGISTEDGILITDVNKVEMKTAVDWVGVLRNRMGVITRELRPSRKRINRRQPFRLELSGAVRKRKLSLVIAIDESGSVSNREYLYFMSEIRSLVRSVECSIVVYEFCTTIAKKTVLNSRKSIDEFFNGKDGKSYSRLLGGTAFQPIFDEVRSESNLDLNNTIVVVLTDGKGEPAVNFEGVKNRLWVVVDDGELSCDEYSRNVYPVVGTPKIKY